MSFIFSSQHEHLNLSYVRKTARFSEGQCTYQTIGSNTSDTVTSVISVTAKFSLCQIIRSVIGVTGPCQ